MKKQLTRQKVPTVTVALCAYNEEENILNMLRSVIRQKETGFIIKKIWVHSDGSTDNTATLVKSLKSPKIKLWDHKNRVGKSTRLNEIYSDLKSDFLVQSDADVVFWNKFTIQNLLKPMLLDPKVGMCGGNPIPLKAETFTEKAVNVTYEAYAIFRRNIRDGNNIFSADGRLLAFRKRVVKKIQIPHAMIANDQFAYYSCLMQREKYKFAKDAIVYYRSPQSLKDQVRQNTRFLASPIRLAKFFPKVLVEKETHIPTQLKLKAYFKQFMRYPFFSIYIFMINRYCQIKAIKTEKIMHAKWPIAISTKALR